MTAIGPVPGLDAVTCAIIGMAAMVGGGTGAAMTAVTMIFEMTRDYDIIMPIIVAVALSHRRAPPAVAREHLHHQAGHPRPSDPQGDARQHVPGAPRRRSDGPRRGAAAGRNRFRRLPARDLRRRLQAHRGDAATTASSACCASTPNCASGWRSAYSGVCSATSRRRTSPSRAPRTSCSTWSSACGGAAPSMAIVTKGSGRLPRGPHVVGMISKEHIADSVADSIRPYGNDVSGPVDRAARRSPCKASINLMAAPEGGRPFVYCVAVRSSARRAQVEPGHADRQIEAGLSLHRKRLQGHGAVGTADQHVGAEAGADRRLRRWRRRNGRRARRTGDWSARKPPRPSRRPRGADIEPEFGDRSDIDFTRSRGETA